MRMYKFWIVCLVLINLYGCGEEETKNIPPVSDKTVDLPAIKNKQLNISVLIDLSNRIDDRLHPQQASRDIAIVGDLTQIFKNNIDAFGAFKADGKLRVYFHPEPSDPEIASIARELTADCKAGNRPENAKHNKQVYQSVDSNFQTGLERIYQLANNKSDYPGSNIWRFMKDEAAHRCLEDTANFRNILVILTDGYLYYKNEMHQTKNRYSYIERNFPHFNKFRDRKVLESTFENEDYGFEPTGVDLNGLEVVVMGINPDEAYPQDFDIIKKYWEKWLKEMDIQHFVLVKTQQPVYSQKSISDFLRSH